MQHSLPADRQTRWLLDKIRVHVDGARSFTDQALLALVVVARTRMEGRLRTRAMRVVGAAGALVTGFALSLVPGMLTFALLTGAGPIIAVGSLCVVVASVSIASCRYGYGAGWRADLYRELRLLLTQHPCRGCGALRTEVAGTATDDPCRACGAPMPSPGSLAAPPRFRHAGPVGAEANGAGNGIADLRHRAQSDADEFLERVRSCSWGRAVRWIGWVGGLGLIACTLFAIVMILGTMTERSLFVQIASAGACVLVGWGLLSLGRSALSSFLHELAESALSPRSTCFDCGYPLTGLETDDHGLSRCSECGLLVRPERRSPTAAGIVHHVNVEQ